MSSNDDNNTMEINDQFFHESSQLSTINHVNMVPKLKHFFIKLLSTVYSDVENIEKLLDECLNTCETEKFINKFATNVDQKFIAFQLLAKNDTVKKLSQSNTDTLVLDSKTIFSVESISYSSCVASLEPKNVSMTSGGESSNVIFIKKIPILNEEKSLPSQIYMMSIDGSLIDSIYSIVSHSLNPLFRSYTKYITNNQLSKDSNLSSDFVTSRLHPNYSSIEKKFTELEYGLLYLQEESHFVTIHLIRHPTVVELYKKYSHSTNVNQKENEILIPLEEIDTLSNDEILLDSLQNYVNKWLKDLYKVIQVEIDPPINSARQEISYWRQLNLSLNCIKNEINAAHVNTTIDILRAGKRLKCVFAWENGRNITDLFKVIVSYNKFMDSLKYDEIIECNDNSSLKLFVTHLFTHMRKVKTSLYPISRLVKFIEAITKDITEKILEIIIPQNLITLKKKEFDTVVSQCFDIFMLWDDEYEKLHCLLRELYKQKREESVKLFYKVNPYHRKLMDRIESIKKFRRLHEELRNIINRISFLSHLNFSTLFGEENSALEEVESAWNIVVCSKYLDITKDGFDKWRHNLARYDEKIDHVESKIAIYLRDELGKAKNSKEMFKIFSHFNALFIRPHIRGAIKEYQKQLLQHVNDDMTALMQKFKLQYINSNACKINRVKDIPSVAGSILWARQIDNQLKLILKKVFDVLGNDLENHVDGKRLKSEIESFRNQLGLMDMLDQWVKNTNEKQIFINGKLFQLHNYRITDNEDKIVKIYRLSVNFTPDMITLAKEVRHMKAMGFRLPLSIINKAHQLSSVYPLAVSLIESLRTYENATNKLKENANLQLLMCGYINDMKNLILEGATLIWESYKVEYYVRKFSEQATDIQEKIDDLMRILNKISTFITNLGQCPYGHSHFESNLHHIQQLVDEITFQSYSNLEYFIENIEADIEKVLIMRLSTALQNWNHSLSLFRPSRKIIGSMGHYTNHTSAVEIRDNLSAITNKGGYPEFKTIKHEFFVVNQEIKLEPPIQNSKSYLVKHLQQWIDIILSQKKLRSLNFKENYIDDHSISDNGYCYRHLLGLAIKNNTLLIDIYKNIDRLCFLADDFVKTWFNYQALWDLPMDTVLQRIISLDDWILLLQSIRESRLTTDTIEFCQDFGCIQIDYKAIQSKINVKYDAWQNDLFAKFSRFLQEEMSSFFSAIQNAREVLETKNIEVASTYEAVSIVNDVQMYRRNVIMWKKKVDNYIIGERILEKGRHKFNSCWIHAETLAAEWESFIQILKTRESHIQKHFVTLQLKVTEQSTLHETQTDELLREWHAIKPTDGDQNCDSAINTLKLYENKFIEINTKRIQIIRAKETLDLTTISSMSFSRDNNENNEVYAALDEIKSLLHVWNEIKKAENSITAIGNQFWLSVHPKRISSLLEKLYEEFVSLPSWIHQYDSFIFMSNKIKALIKANKIIMELKSESFKERHWKLLIRKLKLPFSWSLSELTVQMLWDTDIESNSCTYRDIIALAQGEMALEQFLFQVRDYWENAYFETADYKQRFNVIKSWDNLFNKLREHLNNLNAMKHSPYYKMFEDEAVNWENKLTNLLSLLDTWVVLQRRFIYLDGIFFGSEDVSTLLPKEYKQFQSLNFEFTNLMRRIQKIKIVLKISAISGLQNNIDRFSNILLIIQKSLGDYLEKQRKLFPRFYFVGDEDLLEIVGNSREIERVQKYFNKMFAGITSVILSDQKTENNSIIGILSKENERILLDDPVMIDKNVKINDWLFALDKNLKKTLASLLAKALISYDNLFDHTTLRFNYDAFYIWLVQYPEQIIILVLQIRYCSLVETILSNKNQKIIEKENFDSNLNEKKIHPLSILLDSVTNVLDKLASSVLIEEIFLTRHKIECLISELVHQRNILRLLIDSNVESKEDFLWLSQMRFYFDMSAFSSNNISQCCTVSMADAVFFYGFEYFGTVDRLVQTPLTDLCYLTMTQALKVNLGGSPFGPAGTGKTESVKALAYQLGRFVLVFNCDETFDFQAMGRIFTGLCQVGAWGCFDEFNRLEERMLSAVSQQIQTIQCALKTNSTVNDNPITIELIGRDVAVNRNMAIFITMNPGYAGRSNLPDNLKKLFRSLSMSVPDRELISQVMLYSQGFKNAESLSRKIVPFFNLCNEQLSKQSHYDFGLRALKTVLVSAGSLKRKNLKDSLNTILKDESTLTECRIILQSIHDTILPKLILEDRMLFLSLLSDMFPNLSPLISPYEQLKNYIIKVCEQKHYAYQDNSSDENYRTNEWFEKILQLFNILSVNHGIMLVGPSGSGKTSCWKVLIEALSLYDGIESNYHIIDPKAVSKDELYGVVDVDTREWVDGLFTSCLRNIIDNIHGELQKRHWIIFDGDVDPEWVENLNSMLDDNKLLTLPNGERLSLPETVRIIFEVTDLRYATLATVSRCGMICFNEDMLTLDMIIMNMQYDINQYILNHEMDDISVMTLNDSDHRDMTFVEMLVKQVFNCLSPFFQKNGLVVRAFEYSQKLHEHIMSFSRMRALKMIFGLLAQALRNIYQFNYQNADFSLSHDQITDYVSRYLIWSLIWSVGGDCNIVMKNMIHNFIVENVDNALLPNRMVMSSTSLTLFDFYVDINDYNCSWCLWSDLVPNANVEVNHIGSPDIVIPTVDTIRNKNILIALLNSKIPLILCGPPGSGKTMTLLSAIRSLPNIDIVNLNFSCATTSDLVMRSLDQYCEYRRTANGVVLAPINPRRWLIVFCDEINLPDCDRYGTQKVISFLKQLISQGGFYRTNDFSWVSLERIYFVGACNPPTDQGRKPLPSRFLRHVPVLYVDYPGRESMVTIYGTFVNVLFSVYPSIKCYINAITNSMVEIYFLVQRKFTSDLQPHYVYSPREMTRWIRGIFEFNKNFNDIITIELILKVWAYEALRLFHDRLILNEERVWVVETIQNIAMKYFPDVNVASVLKYPTFFSSWLSNKNYVLVNKEDIQNYLKSRLITFCEEENHGHLVLYDEMIDYALRIDRIYRQPQGHALIIGVNGSGKTTLSKFIAWLNGMSVYQIRTHRKYTINSFEEDLKHVLKRAGCKNEKIVLIINENDLLEPIFVERANTLLANGEIPGLFDGDEYSLLLSQTKELIQQEGRIVDSCDDLYKYFTNNVISNLHIVFIMNPCENGLKEKTSTSPALFNRCVINWFGDWSQSALYQVGLEFLRELKISNPSCTMPDLNTETKESTYKSVIVNTMVRMHESIHDVNMKLASALKPTFTLSPRQFIDFVRYYIAMFELKKDELEKERVHLEIGLSKIKETLENVEKMNKSLSDKRTELERKKELANIKLKQMFDEQQQAENKKQETKIIQAQLEKQTHEINYKQSSVMDELSKVEPAIEDAKKAVSSISKQNLVELKTMSNPPTLVKMALESVCVMLGHPTTDWKEIRGFIMKDDFIQRVVNFSTDNITLGIRHTMEKNYLSKAEYNYEKVNRASNACGPLVKWAIAQVYYAQMLQKVEPLRQELDLLEIELKESNCQLQQAKLTIEELEARITNYKEEYAILVSDIQNIKRELLIIENRVKRSISLISSLDSERSRWIASSEYFRENQKTLTGDILLCSAFLVYGGYFDQSVRNYLWKKWKYMLEMSTISFLRNISPSDYLSNVDEILLWKNNGLPSDKLCVENAIILKHCKRYPLIIDPSGQAYEFITKNLSDKKFTVTSFLDDSFTKSLEMAIRFGMTLLIMDVENFDPIINPILNMDIKKNVGRMLISIGENELDFSPSFSLMLFTRDVWYKIPHDLSSKVTLINFTITPKSLQSQCLDMVLKSERPDVEAKREDLGKMQGEFHRKLRYLEKNLLEALNNVEGSLLDDDCIIETLESLKIEAADISRKVVETDKIIKEVELITNLYVPLSVACSCIYFTLESMNRLHTLYQFNLTFFLSMYQSLLDSTKNVERTMSFNQRIDNILKKLFSLVNDRVSVSLLHEHRIVFALQLSWIRIKTVINDSVCERIFNYFLFPNSLTADVKLLPPLLLELFKKESEIENLLAIEHSGLFKNFIHSILDHRDEMCEWLSTKSLSESIPKIFVSTSDLIYDSHIYEKLCQQLLVQALRPDLLTQASHQLVESILHNNGHTLQVNLYDIVFNEIVSTVPILLCSIVGYDSTSCVDDLVSSCSSVEQIKLLSVAMGSIEGYSLAENALNKASKDGSWVILKNVHLATKWLLKLEKKLLSIKPHKKFRLFMTCEIHPDIPHSIIRMSKIVTFEPPTGIRANLVRTFSALPPSRPFKQPIERSRLYFILAWLHCIITERLQYIPLGWSKYYEFNEGDFRIACDVIDSWVDNASKKRKNLAPSKIPWDAIRTILIKCIYGGKIDNSFDRKILNEFISTIFSEECFNDNFYLIDREKIKLKVPNCRSHSQYLDWINDYIPPNETPDWLNLPNNAEKLLLITKGQKIKIDLLKLQLSDMDSDICLPCSPQSLTSRHSTSSMEQVITPTKFKKVASIVSTWLELIPMDINEIDNNTSISINPIYRFYQRELGQAKNLLISVRNDMKNVLDVCDGSLKRTNTLDEIIDSIVQDNIPIQWIQYDIPKNMPLHVWIVDFIDRINQFLTISSYIINNPLDELYSLPVRLGGFFSPCAFFTASRQYISQKKNLALEELKLDVVFVDNEYNNDTHYFNVKHSYVHGAKIVNGCCELSDDLFSEISLWKFTWKIIDQHQNNTIELPLYLNESRSNLLQTITTNISTVQTTTTISAFYSRGVAFTLCHYSK